MATSARAAELRRLLEQRFAPVFSEIVDLLEAECRERVSAEVSKECYRLAESLNQALRRMRQASGFGEIAGVLADSSTGFCRHAAVFERQGDRLLSRAARAASPPESIAFTGAFRTAGETEDPIIALTRDSDITPELMSALSHASGDQVTIFPIKSAGFLYAWGDVQQAPLELLAQAAGALLPVVKTAAGRLLSIAPAGSAGGWESLDEKEQRVHLRAQQFARAEVAKLRLHRAEQVQEGRRNADLYGSLRHEIDSLRAEFHERYIRGNSNMVDYVHLECLRTLANHDAALLGSSYPGPLV